MCEAPFPDAVGTAVKVPGSAETPSTGLDIRELIRSTNTSCYLVPDSVLGIQERGSTFLALETESWLITKTWVTFSSKPHFAYLESGYSSSSRLLHHCDDCIRGGGYLKNT